MAALMFFWVFLFFMAVGIPIVFALAAGPLAGFLLTDQTAFMKMLPQRMFGGIAQFPILAIPLFILAGEVMNVSGITKSLVNFANVLIGHVRAGLAQANILASIMFAGLSGSAVADTSALGSIFIPAMEKDGYSRAFSAAVTAASSVIGPIIPPSIIMVIYAYVMNVSVAALFLAGIIPGAMVGIGLMVVTAIIGKRRNYPKAERRASKGEVWGAFKPALLPLMTPVIILGGIVSGIVTPTEAAAAAVFYALILSMLITRTVKPADLPGILYRTGLVSSSILLIVGSATIFGWAATVSGVPQALAELLFTITENPYLLLLLVNILLLFIGMFLDAVPAILILGPIFGPALAQVGVDPVHFAIIMCVNVTVGLVTPPMGMILFVASGLTRTGIEKISRELWPYLGVHFLVIVLISMIPALTLTIPRLFGFM